MEILRDLSAFWAMFHVFFFVYYAVSVALY